MADKYRTKGRSQLRTRLQKTLPKEIEKALSAKIKHAGMVVYNEAKRNVPVDEGDLRDSIHIKGSKLAVKVGFWKKGNTRKWKKAGWRSHLTEFGTRGGKDKNGREIPAQKARPFLGPAFVRNKEKIERIVTRAVNVALKRTSRGNFS